MILSGRVAPVSKTRINCGPGALKDLDKLLNSNELRMSRVFVLVDRNTGRHCLSKLVAACPVLDSASLFELEGGESSKTLDSAQKLWDALLTAGADRHSLLVNLGGGVVSDLGGFAAASLKRGIPYVNVPTSLMGMADAAIGGKTGVNMGPLKNQLGFFCPPAAVFIDPSFLKTLSPEELRSGFAEVVKSSLVGDPVLWGRILRQGTENILSQDTGGKFWLEMIGKTVAFKNRVTRQDFRENNIRRVLNFGHTIGHALESLFIDQDENRLLHGDAVALGMIAETWLSQQLAGLGTAETSAIIAFLRAGYGDRIVRISPMITGSSYDKVFGMLAHDKKNRDGALRFTLLESIGKPRINRPAGREAITEALGRLFE